MRSIEHATNTKSYAPWTLTTSYNLSNTDHVYAGYVDDRHQLKDLSVEVLGFSQETPTTQKSQSFSAVPLTFIWAVRGLDSGQTIHRTRAENC